MSERVAALRDWAGALVVGLLSGVAHTVMFPFWFSGGRILAVPEMAFVFLLPLTLWLMRPRPLLQVVVGGLVGGWASWLTLLWWLRHVTPVGTVLLAGVLALFLVAWVLCARWALPRMLAAPMWPRLAGIAGLAGAWVLLEWLRTWLLSGFPWLPLAASQWSRPLLLQVLSITGGAGLAFLIVHFNVAAAFFIHKLLQPAGGALRSRRLGPELYSALSLLLLAVLAAVLSTRGRPEPEPLLNVGFVQPYVAQMQKWDAESRAEIRARLEAPSTFAASQGSHVLLWPEASTPGVIVGPNPAVRLWVQDLSTRLGKPILLGSIAVEPDHEMQRYETFNGIFLVDPEYGLLDRYYSKRKLVPFGEYNPLSFLPWDLTMGLVGETARGGGPETLPLRVPGGELRAGPLVCYEDIFPALARQTTALGADFLFVATNNAWYGEEAGAYQHAVHSILRAVENRRPVLRCGNGGWSGWIDEYGRIAHVAARPGKGIYFEGAEIVPVTRDPSWKGRLSFYGRHGDWFVALAAAFCALGTAATWKVVNQKL